MDRFAGGSNPVFSGAALALLGAVDETAWLKDAAAGGARSQPDYIVSLPSPSTTATRSSSEGPSSSTCARPRRAAPDQPVHRLRGEGIHAYQSFSPTTCARACARGPSCRRPRVSTSSGPDGRLMWMKLRGERRPDDLREDHPVVLRARQVGAGSLHPRRSVEESAWSANSTRSRIYIPNPYTHGDWSPGAAGSTTAALASIVLRPGRPSRSCRPGPLLRRQGPATTTWAFPLAAVTELYGAQAAYQQDVPGHRAGLPRCASTCSLSLAASGITDDKIGSLLTSVPPRARSSHRRRGRLLPPARTAEPAGRVVSRASSTRWMASLHESVVFATTHVRKPSTAALVRSGRIDFRMELGPDRHQLRDVPKFRRPGAGRVPFATRCQANAVASGSAGATAQAESPAEAFVRFCSPVPQALLALLVMAATTAPRDRLKSLCSDQIITLNGITLALSKTESSKKPCRFAAAGITPTDNLKRRASSSSAPTGRTCSRHRARHPTRPTYVQYGAADLGIAGKDVLIERGGAEGPTSRCRHRHRRCRLCHGGAQGFDYAAAVKRGARIRAATTSMPPRRTLPPRACTSTLIHLTARWNSRRWSASPTRSSIWSRPAAPSGPTTWSRSGHHAHQLPAGGQSRPPSS